MPEFILPLPLPHIRDPSSEINTFGAQYLDVLGWHARMFFPGNVLLQRCYVTFETRVVVHGRNHSRQRGAVVYV